MIKAIDSSSFNLYGQLGYIDHTAMAENVSKPQSIEYPKGVQYYWYCST